MQLTCNSNWMCPLLTQWIAVYYSLTSSVIRSYCNGHIHDDECGAVKTLIKSFFFFLTRGHIYNIISNCYSTVQCCTVIKKNMYYCNLIFCKSIFLFCLVFFPNLYYNVLKHNIVIFASLHYRGKNIKTKHHINPCNWANQNLLEHAFQFVNK